MANEKLNLNQNNVEYKPKIYSLEQSKVTFNDPEEVVSEVDPNQITTLTARDEGNSFVLDSIQSETNVEGVKTSKTPVVSETNTNVAATVSEQTAKANAAIEGMKAASTLSTTTGGNSGSSPDGSDGSGEDDASSSSGFDFKTIAEQCSKANSEDLMGSLGSSVTAIGETGDVLALDNVRASLDNAGFDSTSIIDTIAPGVVGVALSSFNLDELIPNISEDLLGPYADTFNKALSNFTNNWYWLDKELGIYNYDILSRISPWALNFLELNPEYSTVVKLARGLYGHRKHVSE